MNYRYYTTKTVKQKMTQPSLMWWINQISSIERKLRNKELKRVGSHVKDDLRDVINQLNQTINELLMNNENNEFYKNNN